GYSTQKVQLEFEPRVVGKFRAALCIKFDGNEEDNDEEDDDLNVAINSYENANSQDDQFNIEQKKKPKIVFRRQPVHSGPVYVLVEGCGTDVAIFLERDIVDFKVCHMGEPYRDTLIAYNRSKISLQCHIEIPQPLQPFLNAVPEMGFCQANGGNLNFRLRFHPQPNIFDFLPPSYVDKTQALVEVPISIRVVDQPLPATFLFRATISSPEISFGLPIEDQKSDNQQDNKQEQKQTADDATQEDLKIKTVTQQEITILDLGSIPYGGSVSSPLLLNNHSLLPQHYAFIHLPKEIEVTPHEGIGLLLPKETQRLCVTITPQTPDPLQTVLNLASDSG
ncbi:MAG: putative flagellar associated protein, partial [Streblomastix strix]